MNKSKLKLNDDNIELVASGDRIRLRDISKGDLLGSSTVPFKQSAKYLDVHVGESLSMDLQTLSISPLFSQQDCLHQTIPLNFKHSSVGFIHHSFQTRLLL